MKPDRVRWILALSGALAAEVVLIAAAFAWVAIYSYVVHPGETAAFYQRYALKSGPWVSILMGIPVFSFACRWIARAGPTAMALFGIYLVLDVALLTLLAGDNPNLTFWHVAASYLSKFLACHFGVRSAAKTGVGQPA